jgi:uncharacterized protein (TIGR02145 family)
MRQASLFLFLGLNLTIQAQLPDYVPQEGLIGWYPLAGDAFDQSSNANSGFFEGPTTTVDRFGNPSGARYFDGESDHFQVSGASISTSFSALNPVTVSLWVFGSEGSQDNLGRSLIGKGLSPEMVYDTNPKSFMLFNENAQDFSFIVYSDHHDWVRMQVQMSDLILQDDWNHLTFRYHGGNDPNSLSIFRNGESISACCSTINYGNYTGMNLNDEPFILGSRIDEDGNHFLEWEGALDDLGIWSRDLSDEEALELYLSSAPNAGCIDFEACNYNPEAFVNDGSCEYGCLNCGPGTLWDDASQLCIVANPSDTNFDGCVSMTDLLDLLTVFGTCNETPWSCGDQLDYQGYDYETVQIGEQCWFAENARHLPFVSPSNLGWEDDGDAHAYVVGYEGTSVEEAKMEDDYATFGALYNFAAVEELVMCPQGWHVPSVMEWNVLEAFAGPAAANKLKSAPPVWDGTNELGFNAIRVPVRISSGSFGAFNVKADFWTSTPSETSENNAWGRELNTGQEEFTHDENGKNAGQPVRCIKDSE